MERGPELIEEEEEEEKRSCVTTNLEERDGILDPCRSAKQANVFSYSASDISLPPFSNFTRYLLKV